ncbi:glycoside hydrolase [Galbibacter marinus]|uniref:Glycoside hydrolase n=1 Tax=Galbibacter marinus TaxID=555500 RepID=K2Q6I5_9FLAO|nr:beta-galactosidase GalB [Galbibacter marinus]EKF56481.1 glycoside hydrolase [Galbibacter marinus]
MINLFLIKPLKGFWIIGLILFLGACTSSTIVQKESNSRKQSFNQNWDFYLSDLKDEDSISDQTQWKSLDLPHDWSIETAFDKQSPVGHGGGYLTGGLGWYKKDFTVDKQDSSKRISIHFDGVYCNSEVWINGHYLGKRPNGYIGFEYDITPYLNFGQTNQILVKVDNSNQPNSRWYSGSGIYRNVWLKKTEKLYVVNWGTFITTPKVSKDQATVNVVTTIGNDNNEEKTAVLRTRVLKDGQEITQSEKEFLISSKANQELEQQLEINTPELWSDVSPELYTAISEILIEGNLIDQKKTNFGIRNFRFDLDKGFILNGVQTKIKGVCLHHDLGPLGAAVNTRAIERKLEIMKEMGVNGIRTAHNPPSPELLDLCDQMGFIVMDEAFDMWAHAKNPHDYATVWEQWHKKDLEDQILRDRNHPSVFMWSIGNEIPEQWSPEGAEIGRELSAIVKGLDTTRVVTAGMNPPIHVNNDEVTIQFEDTAAEPNALAGSGALDLIGYNYAHQTYEDHQKNFPNTPFIASETTSGLQTRGFYEFPSDTTKIWPVRWDLVFTQGNEDNTVSAFDQVRTPWGSLHEETWKIIKKHDFLSGMFVWTGFDYIGEPTPYQWPSRSSYFGIVDLAGFPKDVYYMYQSEWTDTPVLHVFPHWNWEEDTLVDLWVYYNNADEVELFLNGESLGVKSKEGDDLHLMWRVPYEKGTLKAVSRKDGKVVLEREVKTAGIASELSLTADRSTIYADGEDLSFITVGVMDENGVIVPRAADQISFTIDGPGKIVGVANGDPTNHESFKGQTHKAFNGKCLVVLQAGREKGNMVLTATAPGLKQSTINIQIK